MKLLNVDHDEIKNCNCVSSFVADTMGRHAAELFESDWCIATSGYCIPERHSAYEVFAYYSITYRGKVVFSDKLELNSSTESLQIKMFYTDQILQKFIDQLRLHQLSITELNTNE